MPFVLLELLLLVVLLVLGARFVVAIVRNSSSGLSSGDVERLRARVQLLEESAAENELENARLREAVEFTNKLLSERAEQGRLRDGRPDGTEPQR